MTFDRIDNNGRGEDKLEKIYERLLAWYTKMVRLDMTRAEKAAPRIEVQRSSVEYFLLAGVVWVVT